MRIIGIAIGILCLVSTVHAQSQDEEETVVFEGSANAPTDDEDIVEGSGSSLPPDPSYAINPVQPKMTTTTESVTTTRYQATSGHPRQTTTLVKQQMATQVQTSTPRISTRAPHDDGTLSGTWASIQSWIVIAMVLVVAGIFVGIVVIVCCCKNRQKAGYAPAKQMES